VTHLYIHGRTRGIGKVDGNSNFTLESGTFFKTNISLKKKTIIYRHAENIYQHEVLGRSNRLLSFDTAQTT
jgi:hypothetical protein